MKKALWFLLPAAVLAVAAAAWFWGVPMWRSSGGGPAPRDIEAFRRRVRLLGEKHAADNRELGERFRRELDAAGNADFQRALDNVADTAARFGEFGTCGSLICAMARDKMKHTAATQELLVGILGDGIIAPCRIGGGKATEALSNHLHRLRENDNRFRAELALELDDPPGGVDDPAAWKKFQSDLGNVASQAVSLSLETGGAAVSAIIEAAVIRQTAAAIARLAAPVVAKMIGSAVAPAADGPLPVGDVIAVLGFAWSVYDIHRVTEVLPPRLEEALRTAITDCRDNLKEELFKAGDEARRKSDRAAEKIVNDILQGGVSL